MSQEQEPIAADTGSEVDGVANVTGAAAEPALEREKAPPVESRFMFVDIAALRAKQLRRGALARVDSENVDADGGPVAERDRKLERIAMAEVHEGLIHYDATPPPTFEEKQQAERNAAEAAAGGAEADEVDTTEEPES
jgi:DNA-directed RNA polymerase subunit K/omega